MGELHTNRIKNGILLTIEESVQSILSLRLLHAKYLYTQDQTEESLAELSATIQACAELHEAISSIEPRSLTEFSTLHHSVPSTIDFYLRQFHAKD
jgi:two-component sensor histidine kinase